MTSLLEESNSDTISCVAEKIFPLENSHFTYMIWSCTSFTESERYKFILLQFCRLGSPNCSFLMMVNLIQYRSFKILSKTKINTACKYQLGVGCRGIWRGKVWSVVETRLRRVGASILVQKLGEGQRYIAMERKQGLLVL